MQTREQTQAIKRVLKKPVRALPAEFVQSSDPVTTLVQSFLLWECPADKALLAYQRIQSSVVDFNELRVCLPHETLEILGPRFPRAEERAQRLRASLNDLYRREHAVNLDRVAALGKREAKQYVDSLEGIVSYVANRLSLLSFGVHGVPADERLRDALASAGIVEPTAHPDEVSNWLGRTIKAEKGVDAHHRLQAWVEKVSRRGKSRSVRTGSAKTTKRGAGARSRQGSTRKTKRSAAPTAGKSS